MTEASPVRRLDGFVGRYDPDVARIARRALKTMRIRLPGAVALVYDNYNALAVAFGPSERTSESVFSITLYPRWVSLFFTRGAELPDPERLLRGSGNVMRHLVLDDAATLDRPAVRALMTAALAQTPRPIDRTAPSRIVIKSVSARQRPRSATAPKGAPVTSRGPTGGRRARPSRGARP